MYIGSYEIDDVLTFYARTYDLDTPADADAVPAYRVYEDETGTPILTGNMALIDSSNTDGKYSEQITLSAANGFEFGKSYSIDITATVGSQGGATERWFQVGAKVSVHRWLGTTPQTPTVAGVPVVDLVLVGGDLQHGLDFHDFLENGYDAATNKINGVKLVDALHADYDAAKTAASQTSVNDLPTNAEFQAGLDALNQSASRRIQLSTSAQYERPESGSSTYTVEVRTYDGDGAATNADSTPTVTPTGIVSGSLAANLGAGSNPATGVYRYVYTVANDAAIEQIQMAASAEMSDGTFTIAAYPQVADFVAATFTTADRDLLAAAATQTSVDAIGTNMTTALARIGAFTGTGVNTILGFFKALMSKAASTPSDVGGTFAAADDSTEKISETATAAAADALLARKIEEADMYTDTETTPWQFVFMEKGTGGIGVGVEIMRKDIKTPAGVDVTADTTAIGQLVEP